MTAGRDSSGGKGDSGGSGRAAGGTGGQGAAGAATSGTAGSGTGGSGTGGSSTGGSGTGGSSAGRGGSTGTAGSGGSGMQAGEGGVGSGEPVALPGALVYFREPIGDPLDDVWGTDGGEVYAVGYGGTIAHDPGDGTFVREHVSTTSLEFYSVWGSSATDVYVGIAGGKLGHASGAGSWTRRDLYNVSGPVYQVFGFGPDDMYLATGALFHGTLNNWQKIDKGPPANSVWGSSPNDLYTVATASLDQPNVFHSNGDGTWHSQATTGEYLSRVFGLDARHVYAIGSHSIWFSAGDGAWRSVLTLSSDAPISLWGRDGLVYVGTQNGKLYVTNGDEFSAGQAIGTATGPRITGVWAASAQNVYLATSSGLYHGTPDGSPPSDGAGGAGGEGNGGSGGGSFSTDPNDFGGNTRCSPNAVQCEDFESGDLDSDWSKLGDITVDQVHAARGDYALHVHNAAAFGGGTVESWTAFPRPYDRFWLRLFVYLEALPSDIGPWSLVRADDAIPANGGVTLGGYSDGAGSNVLEHTLQTPFVSLKDSPDAQIPAGEWICLEWYNDGLSDEARVFWNNVERPALHATPALASTVDSGKYSTPEIDYVEIGWGSTLSTPLDLWIDAIAIGSERIGCEH